MAKPTVFISYSHKNEAWKDRVVTHLGVPGKQGMLDAWDDRRIGAGEEDHAREHLAAAKAMIEEMGYHRRDAEVAELEGALGEA